MCAEVTNGAAQNANGIPTADAQSSKLLYIVPFKYSPKWGSESDGLFRRIFDLTEKTGHWKRVTDPGESESDLYRYVREEFIIPDNLGDFDKKAGAIWELEYGNPPVLTFFTDAQKQEKGTETRFRVTVDYPHMYLFRGGFGFFCYGLVLACYGGKRLFDSDRMLDFQDAVKELNWGKVILWKNDEYPTGVSDQNGNPVKKKCYSPFFLGAWIGEKLKYLRDGGFDVSFFAERKMKDLERVAKESAEELKKRLSYVSIHPDYLKIAKEAELRGENASQTGEKSAPDKAILFSYVLLNGNLDPEFLDAYAWRLANGFNSKYRYSAATSQTIFAPFENVRICATKGGACYVAYPTEKTRGFFESQKGKIVSDYYPLFIKALYQSYALHANAEKVQKHVSFERDSDIDPGLFEDINRFLVKTTASSVSFIQHQSDFYNYLKKQLRIDEDTASLVEYFTRLKEEIDRKREEYEDKEQRESDGTRDWALALISFMAVFSALTDCYDWVGKVLDSEGAVKYGCWDWRVWVALICHGLIVLAFIAAICIIIISWRKRKKKGKKKGS